MTIPVVFNFVIYFLDKFIFLFLILFVFPPPSLSLSLHIHCFLSLSSLTTSNGHRNRRHYTVNLLLCSQRHHHPSRSIHSNFPHHHHLNFLFRPQHHHHPSPQIHQISHITKHDQNLNRRSVCRHTLLFHLSWANLNHP